MSAAEPWYNERIRTYLHTHRDRPVRGRAGEVGWIRPAELLRELAQDGQTGYPTTVKN